MICDFEHSSLLFAHRYCLASAVSACRVGTEAFHFDYHIAVTPYFEGCSAFGVVACEVRNVDKQLLGETLFPSQVGLGIQPQKLYRVYYDYLRAFPLREAIFYVFDILVVEYY